MPHIHTFKFDETTTSQTKKRYYVYFQCWSAAKNEITNAICRSVFIRHCIFKDLRHHYHEFEKLLGLNSTYLLHLGMNGPNVNKKFSNIVTEEIEEKHNIQFLDLGTCSLHPVHINVEM